MNIEDLTHNQYIEISKALPKKMKFSDLKKYRKIISEKYNLPSIDAMGGVFVGIEINNGIDVMGYEAVKIMRINEVLNIRNEIGE